MISYEVNIELLLNKLSLWIKGIQLWYPFSYAAMQKPMTWYTWYMVLVHTGVLLKIILTTCYLPTFKQRLYMYSYNHLLFLKGIIYIHGRFNIIRKFKKCNFLFKLRNRLISVDKFIDNYKIKGLIF